MRREVVWTEPWPFSDGDGEFACEIRVSVEDVIKWQRRREPRYTSDKQALEDFLVIHWASLEERPDVA